MRPGRRRCSEFSGFALRLRCSRMPALPQTDTLLLDVHEFVRQTRRTFCGVGCETTSAEEDVRADCKGVGMSVGPNRAALSSVCTRTSAKLAPSRDSMEPRSGAGNA